MAKAVLLTVVFLLVIGIAFLCFAEACGVTVGEDNATIEQVKDTWSAVKVDLFASIEINWGK